MPTPNLDELRFARLAALADDDPDATLNPASRDILSADASGSDALTQRVAEQKRLRGACARVMNGPEYRCPDGLRAQLTGEPAGFALSLTPAAPPAGASPPPIAGRIGPRRWVSVIAAAALVAVSTVTVVGTYRTLRPSLSPAGTSGLVVPVLNDVQARALDQRHRVCGSDPTALFQNESFPETLGGLDDRLTEVIDASLGSAQLDLSALGFQYRGAGRCEVPGPGAVHVVYANDAGRALSLWVRPHDGRMALDPGQIYGPATDGQQAGRIRVWRDGDVVLYLVGDLPDDVKLAQPRLALYPA